MQTVPSLEDSVCASSSQVFLNLRSAQCLDDRVDLSVVVAQAGLGVTVWGRQTSNVTVLLLGLERWCSLDGRVRVARRDDRLGGLRIGYGSFWLRSTCSTVVARGLDRLLQQLLFLALRFRHNLLDRLVAALSRLPSWVTEWLVNLLHVELIEKRHVIALVRCRRDGCHGAGSALGRCVIERDSRDGRNLTAGDGVRWINGLVDVLEWVGELSAHAADI